MDEIDLNDDKQVKEAIQLLRTLKCKKLSTSAILPTRADSGAAGYDLYYSGYEYILEGGELRVFPTDIAMAIPEGYWGEIKDRSGRAIKDVTVRAGVIDSSYRGPVGVVLKNTGKASMVIRQGERIAQIIFQKYEAFDITETDTLPETDRGEGGFGSTGA